MWKSFASSWQRFRWNSGTRSWTSWIRENDLESYQADLATRNSSLADTGLELKNCKDALANTKQALQAANRDRIVARRPREQEVFVVLRFQKPMPLPIGAYRIFAVQRKAAESTLEQFIADYPELDAIEMEELRFVRSPRGHNVIQAMNADTDSPSSYSIVHVPFRRHLLITYVVDYMLQARAQFVVLGADTRTGTWESCDMF